MFSVHGPALVDYFYFIDKYPEKGKNTLIKSFFKSAGGAGANVAHNLAKIGIDAKIFTSIGRDDDAKFFLENTTAEVYAEVTHEKTGKVLVFVDSSGERTFFIEPNASEYPVFKKIKCKYLYVDPFPSKKSFDVQLEVLKNSEAFKILNPCHIYSSMEFEKLKDMLEFVDMLILSHEELKELKVDFKEILKFVDYLIVTKGAEGSECITSEASYYAKAFKTKVVDTTGAGDAFAAGFIYGFMRELPIEICLKLGNFCGAYKVSRIGARNFPSFEEIESFLAKILK
ncbi:MAG: PfkB family carbohydrate kinase [Archaeoglobaceae archaeon]|nr:PfkB family carbohydrate kinase [Archaeoglobaceae archaeon]MCX8152105.1 PfkB family carbohydrate kinase [Archaeoglobaceae archaeon]MDW8013540.1 PfkB family carbohydrate kinase [Archaeoglobaceae archaeon]